MDFVTAFSPAAIAFWSGLLMMVAGSACVVLIFALRKRSERAEQHLVNAAVRWEETIFQATLVFDGSTESDSATEELKARALRLLNESPDFEKLDLPLVMYEWNYVHECLVGDSKLGLNLLADQLDLYERSLRSLRNTTVDRRLLAINTLGNLADSRSYEAIEEVLADRDPAISSWAWRALFRVSVEETLERHLGMIAKREDWSPTFIARVLHDIDADDRSAPLCRLVDDRFRSGGLSERQMSRLISYLSLAHVADHAPIVNHILLKSDQTEILIACLRLINSDDDLTKIRSLVNDPRWEIRMQVALTLGRLGHEEDIDRMIGLLNDPDWWVRYRTASALMSMPGMTKSRANRLTRTLPNRFARDILKQVLAEMQITCFPQTSLTLSR